MSKAMDAQRKVLGKGLSALLPQKHAAAQAALRQDVPPTPPESPGSQQKSSTKLLPVHQIHPNPSQPRQDFDETRLSELAQSIRANGIIQPVTVCETRNGNYMIIAGERRWRAATLAGLSEIPVFVRDVHPDRILELALIENIQREDLNPIETALAFEQLIGQYGLTHEQIADRTGKDRSTITNFLRLLRLTPKVKESLIQGRIAMGHARALLGVENPTLQAEACEQVIAKELSVRQTEQLAKEIGTRVVPAPTLVKPERKVDANTRAALDEMGMVLGTKVKIVPRTDHSGRLEIEYYTNDDLQRIYEAIVPTR